MGADRLSVRPDDDRRRDDVDRVAHRHRQGSALHARHRRLDQGMFGAEQGGECVHARILTAPPSGVNPEHVSKKFI